MTAIANFFMLTLFLSIAVGAPECDDGWTNYEGKICVKAFDHVATYEEAQQFCTAQGDGQGSLVIVKDAEMQQFLVDFTEGLFDYVWLGAKYNDESSQFLWQDGSPLKYSNWQDGYPKDISDNDACIELRPGETRSSMNIRGKWAHLTCRKRNLVMCQKSLMWTLDDAVAEILRLTKQVSSGAEELSLVRDNLEQTKNRLTDVSNELSTVTAAVVPIGSIYVEYYNQPSPQSLWPTLSWEDISSTYAGLFFRASGGASADWGSTQTECAPRIAIMDYTWGGQYPYNITIPSAGWSAYGHAGASYYNSGTYIQEGLRFYTEVCEVRPKNQAIRIWKRMS